MKFASECRMCDGTGSLCPTCGDSAHGCPCKGVIIVDTCPACDGTGDEPSEAADAAMLDAILSTSDADVMAGRWNKPNRK